MQPNSPQPCLVDAHVHLYRLFNPLDIVEAASTNFARLASELDLGSNAPGFLLLTQTESEPPPIEVFAGLPQKWQHTVIDDLGTLLIKHESHPDLYIVPGWQVITREGLEVLALASKHIPPSNRSAAETLGAVQRADGLPVLPWGIGKWTGSRESEIRRLIEEAEFTNVFFGDISGRLNLLSRPHLLSMAETAGHKVLAGTDPLPLAGEAQKIGRFGFGAQFDPDQPVESLKAWLQSESKTPQAAGKTETLTRFLKLQLTIQIKKRLR